MDPPEAYDPMHTVTEIDPNTFPLALKKLYDEHQSGLEIIKDFETNLIAYKEKQFQLSREINESFAKFFEYFDAELLPHNRKEERHLFPILNDELIASGEHSTEGKPTTAVDLMEDDHVKFIQLGTLTFNFLGLAPRIMDPQSKGLILDIAYNNGIELVEMLKLHIFREDNTLFPLAAKLISAEKMTEIHEKFENFSE